MRLDWRSCIGLLSMIFLCMDCKVPLFNISYSKFREEDIDGLAGTYE